MKISEFKKIISQEIHNEGITDKEIVIYDVMHDRITINFINKRSVIINHAIIINKVMIVTIVSLRNDDYNVILSYSKGHSLANFKLKYIDTISFFRAIKSDYD